MKVTLLDSGASNINSVSRALTESGAGDLIISSEPKNIVEADRLVLPGVGAFKNGMQSLSDRGLTDSIIKFYSSGRPLLGICLGMQMLGSKSFEFGEVDGLNLINGQTVQIPKVTSSGGKRIVPFVGWSKIKVQEQKTIFRSVLNDVRENDSVYFTHSYQFNVENTKNLLATYDYDGHTITAAIKHENVTGLQFHPEKSGEVGLKILRSFLLE